MPPCPATPTHPVCHMAGAAHDKCRTGWRPGVGGRSRCQREQPRSTAGPSLCPTMMPARGVTKLHLAFMGLALASFNLQFPYPDSVNSAKGVCSLLMGGCSPMSSRRLPHDAGTLIDSVTPVTPCKPEVVCRRSFVSASLRQERGYHATAGSS